jgi:hypothetical protein
MGLFQSHIPGQILPELVFFSTHLLAFDLLAIKFKIFYSFYEIIPFSFNFLFVIRLNY